MRATFNNAAYPVEPFTLHVTDDVLADLKARLARTRLPDTEPKGAPWRYGTSLAYMRDVVAHWRDRYDWRKWEARINAFSHYKTNIGGRKVHFILERGSGDNPPPLLITHGWPGSFVEFLDIIERLAHPERFGGDVRDAFTVVAPSLPGYGFSDPPDAPIGPRDVAPIWSTLMTEVLGCEKYLAQGGDWGAVVTSWLALDHPKNLAAIHLTMVGLRPPLGKDMPPLSEEEKAWAERAQERRAQVGAYQQIQGTKPQTLAYGLTDSPAGLAAWILEKFHDWTIPNKDAPPPFDIDHLLTNVMLYWIGGINAANWLYVSIAEGTAAALKAGEYVNVPTGVLLFPDDLPSPAPPEGWIRRSYNLTRRNMADRGGHFPAMENGELLVADMRAYFAAYR
ncbi:MAG TPA: epoxide hydrolase [Bradyrhizobium sp.]|nr:epoxide hydrolase [Bradyrhizobium sp.]